MKQNETLKAMLANYQPNLGDSDKYISNLQRRLDAIETVKQMYETERRKIRNRLIVAFVSGGIAGVAMAFYIMLHPIAPITTDQLPAQWMVANVNIIVKVLAITVFSVLIAIVSSLFYQIFKKDYSAVTSPSW